MPETDQASQFITALEPFYKVAYVQEERAPPIFNIFHKKHITASSKMNGHVSPIKENGDILNTSHASALHNINGHAIIIHDGQSNGESTNRGLNEVKPDPCDEDGRIFTSDMRNVHWHC
jgi:hypothetical protein